jgi:hypothetical protein
LYRIKPVIASLVLALSTVVCLPGLASASPQIQASSTTSQITKNQAAIPSGTWTPMNSGTANDLVGIWGSSASSIFAVGAGGTILHFDGTTWSPMNSGTSVYLSGIWGSASSNVFAVGTSGTILHYNGSTWSSMTSGITTELLGIWGSSSTDVFAVGAGDTILHYDGSTWSPMSNVSTNGELTCVWGSSASDVFVSGWLGQIQHYDGTTWSAMNSGIPDYPINCLWGSSASDVFASAYYGTILHYDGSDWSPMTTGTTNRLLGIWGSSSSDVYAAGWFDDTILHYDGNAWTSTHTGSRLYNAIWGNSAFDIYAVGRHGLVVHYVGPTTPATVSFNPNTLNLKSKGDTVTAYIELPADYDPTNISIASITLNCTVPALAKPTAIGDNNKNGIPDLMVKFDRGAVGAILSAGDNVKVTITGTVDRVQFNGIDYIRVIK